ncbi:MAG: hypothetical protein ACRBHB_06345 [Arenicella sp.]
MDTFSYLIILVSVGFFCFLMFIIAQVVLVERISLKYPELYESLGKPWSFWSGPRNFKFAFTFILARCFKLEKLDEITHNWCEVPIYFWWFSNNRNFIMVKTPREIIDSHC